MSELRSFETARRVRLGDATSGGRLRFDGLARYLQDIAADDTEDAHMPGDRGWILRRMDLDVGRLPAVYEDVILTTWCSGVGSRWAERTTTLSGIDGLDESRTALAHGVLVTARAVWVNIDLDSGSPRSLPPEFFAAYGDEIREHPVSARLKHPRPGPQAVRGPWPVRSTDFDVFGHVNNAVYWSAIEERLEACRTGRRVRGAEIEFRGGLDPGDACELVTHSVDDALWIWFAVAGDVRASAVVHLDEASDS